MEYTQRLAAGKYRRGHRQNKAKSGTTERFSRKCMSNDIFLFLTSIELPV